MKNKNKMFLAVIALLGFNSAINAQNAPLQTSATEYFTANAQIVRPITIIKKSDLNFGTIIANNGGTVTIVPDPNIWVYTSNDVYIQDQMGVSAAFFEVSGDNRNLYTITKPTSVMLFNGLNNGAMIADQFKTSVDYRVDYNDDSNMPVVAGFDENGYSHFSLGATLHVNANQPSGQYFSDPVPVTVNYY